MRALKDIPIDEIRIIVELIVAVTYIMLSCIFVGSYAGGMSSLWAVGLPFSFKNIIAFGASSLNFIGILVVAAYCATAFLWLIRDTKRMRMVSAWVCALFLSSAYLAGWLISTLYQLDLVTLQTFPGFLFLVIVGAALMYPTIAALFTILDRVVDSRSKDGEFRRYGCRAFFALACILIIAWVPYLLAFAPGSSRGMDMATQLNMFFGNEDWSSHHPILSSMIYGIVAKIGYVCGGDDCIILAIAIFQTLILAFCFATMLFVLRNEFECSRVYVVLCVLFFSLVPIWGIFAQWNIKDVLFTVGFVFYLICLSIFSKTQCVKNLTLTIVAAFLVCLLRKNGFAVVLLSMPLSLLFVNKDKRMKVAGVILLSIFLMPMGSFALERAVNATSGSEKEMLSVPFQQTARYACEYPDEVTSEEKEILGNVLDYEHIAELYNPGVSDPVKGTYSGDADALPSYFSVWIQQGMKHPKTYLEATIANSYKYWYPENYSLSQNIIAMGVQIDDQNFLRQFMSHPEKAFDWHGWQSNEERESRFRIIDSISKLPIINVLCNTGIYGWALFLILGYLIHRRNARYLCVYIAALVLFLTCVASPVNGSIRYSLGYIAAMPLLLGYLKWATQKSVLCAKSRNE